MSAAAAAPAKVIAKAGIPTKIYQALVKSAEPFVPAKLQPLWNHPAGKSVTMPVSFVFSVEIIVCEFNVMAYDMAGAAI